MAWDYIIVGAGSAGCVLANRLSADPAAKVLLIEAGGSDSSPILKAPAATELWGIGNPRFDWRFLTEPDPSRNGRVDLWPRGKVLGGSSSINGMVYLRGQRDDFDHWAQLGNRGWSFDDVLPYFRKSECNARGESAYHRGDGPMSVSDVRTPHRLTRLFVESAVAAGMPFNPDLNGASQEGVGYFQVTQKRGRRESTATAFLHPVRRRANLKVATRAQVARVLFEGRRAAAVEMRHRGRQRVERAAREIVLSAGSLGSPPLLMHSGVGPAGHLSEHGINIVADSPGVGENLQNHVAVYVTFEVDLPTLNNERGPLKMLRHGLDWLLFGNGPVTTPGGQATAFVRTREGLAVPDAQVQFTPVGYRPTLEKFILFDESVVTAVAYVNRPHSRGRLRLKSRDPLAPPAIHPNLLGDRADVEALAAAARTARRIFQTEPLARHVVRELAPGADTLDNDQWEAFLRREAAACFHPVGTCRMGRDDRAVVDDRLRVRGVEGLRVADASIMPTLVSGNTNAASIMIGEKAADLILGD